jgi:hypothetical protein
MPRPTHTCWPCSHNSHIVVLHLRTHSHAVTPSASNTSNESRPRNSASALCVQHVWLAFGLLSRYYSVCLLVTHAEEPSNETEDTHVHI